MIDVNVSERRIKEAVFSIREKDIKSATIERLRIAWMADEYVQGLPQQLQIGKGLYYILDNISTPISSDDLILGRINEEIPDESGEELLELTAQKWGRGIPPWMLDGGHETFAWEMLIKQGLSGLEEFAKQELERRIKAGEMGACINFLKGAILIYEALRNYLRRYADSAYKVGLYFQAKNCYAIADNPPKTFAEALQLIWIVGLVYCCIGAVNATLTFGRLDELLYDFYINDLNEGRLNRDGAGALIEDFYCKNNLILGRGEHQMSGGTEKDTGWLRNLAYDSPQYVVLGGYKKDSSINAGDLTRLFIERIVPEFENPVVVFRYTKETQNDIWELVCDKMRKNASIMVYNDEAVIPAMINSGIEKDDAITYTMHGCNWPDIPGKERPLGHCSLSLPHIVLSNIMDGEEPKSIDEIYERFTKSIRLEIDKCFENFRRSRLKWDSLSPGHLRIDDCFQEGTITKARSWALGGIKYPTLLGNIRFIGTAIDCLSAVDELVFRTNKITMSELRQALREDFEGNEPLRQLCLNAPKFGQDDDRADSHGVRILDIITREFDRASKKGTQDEVIATRCLTTDMGHIHAGTVLGATPDGRHAGMPVSDNTSPYPGSCNRGITAMFRSLSKLPFNRFNSGALNVRIQKRIVSGEEGLKHLSALLRTYFDMGGLQVQLSVADTAELIDAQVNPEAHRDLMVRITGYSAVFIDMCKKAQDEIIRRQEMEE